MFTSMQIFIGILIMYVIVVDLVVVRSMRQIVVPEPVRLLSEPVHQTPRARCYDKTLYIGIIVPVVGDNARHGSNVLSTLLHADHKGLRVHLLLMGTADSQLYTHRQWCSSIVETQDFSCSLILVEDTDAHTLFQRVLADFACIQDLVLLSMNVLVYNDVYSRLNLAPRDKVTCLSTAQGRCPAYRVSSAYMKEHEAGSDIISGAKRSQRYYGSQPIVQ